MLTCHTQLFTGIIQNNYKQLGVIGWSGSRKGRVSRISMMARLLGNLVREREAFKLGSLLRGWSGPTTDPFCPPSPSGMLSPRDLSLGDRSAIERNSSVEREKLGENRRGR